MDLINAASSAHAIPAAVPYRAARRVGEPPRASTISTATTARQAAAATVQWPLVGLSCPPRGSAAAMKTASPAHAAAAPAHAAPATACRIHTRRSTSAMTSSVTSSGWTTETWPSCNANAWNPKAAACAPHPANIRGLRSR